MSKQTILSFPCIHCQIHHFLLRTLVNLHNHLLPFSSGHELSVPLSLPLPLWYSPLQLHFDVS